MDNKANNEKKNLAKLAGLAAAVAIAQSWHFQSCCRKDVLLKAISKSETKINDFDLIVASEAAHPASLLKGNKKLERRTLAKLEAKKRKQYQDCFKINQKNAEKALALIFQARDKLEREHGNNPEFFRLVAQFKQAWHWKKEIMDKSAFTIENLASKSLTVFPQVLEREMLARGHTSIFDTTIWIKVLEELED